MYPGYVQLLTTETTLLRNLQRRHSCCKTAKQPIRKIKILRQFFLFKINSIIPVAPKDIRFNIFSHLQNFNFLNLVS